MSNAIVVEDEMLAALVAKIADDIDAEILEDLRAMNNTSRKFNWLKRQLDSIKC